MKWSKGARRTGMAWMCLLLSSAAVAAPMTRDAQRSAFKQAYEMARSQGGNAWRAAASGLKDYPLYPYLEAAAIRHDLRSASPARVKAYMARYPDMIPAQRLRRSYLYELARRKDWGDFRAMYRPGLGDTLACDALQAKLAAGQSLSFDRDLAQLWRKPSLPNACDPVQTWAQAHGLLTRKRLWARIEAAAEARRGGTIASLARWLPKADRASAEHLALGVRDPSRALAAAQRWPNTAHNRQAVTLAMTAMARHDSDQADAAWKKLRHRFGFSAEQRHRIEADLALFRATDFSDNALHRLEALPAAAQTDATREWRARVALSRRNWKAALAAINAMPADLRDDDEWQYFRARALAKLGRSSQATQAFDQLAEQATYYGFLAADRAGRPYAICPLSLDDRPVAQQSLLQRPGLERAFELFAVDLLPQARREWNRALDDASTDTKRLAAHLAYQRGWYDRAIFTFSSGDALHLYRYRFPLARQDGVTEQSADAGIDPAWAYAILRAESAWMPDAHSGADARGLMQLLPSTASLVARRYNIGYGGGQDLYNPRTNIALGTHYLSQMAGRYNGAPWLASAAYNAGPGRVDQWLAARGDLPPDVFVATIPFHETRDYVARVMAFSVIYDWRLHGYASALSARMPRFGQPYQPPGPNSVHKPVRCPAPDPAPQAASGPHRPAATGGAQ
ncbi:transglycosylase SLT domain-containing protein [Oleiagrimonas sp. C23AA]|uniref:transglycosylase SLT domain-containing protein n=1 Tax=Oleiagrimonas sp. C23AA TaxID=2719047 RepID=UPI0014228EA4|nr:transglycosylase SLT domain-containing protein [Oleiagrimonas sp. C23AA]NII11395.1 transglycosylase SLT domain-containing protein [Oleiagrimonas sp. C23AA]